MNWEAVKLRDVCSYVTSGGTPLTSRSDYYIGGTIPWMKTTEIHKEFIYQTENFITEAGLENSSTKLIPVNSVIVAMYGDGGTAGKVAINKIPLCTNQACCNLVINDSVADYNFIFYLLKINYQNLVNLKLGGSQQNLNAEVIKNFEIKLPPLPIQRRIADVLGRYDALIENYQRQIGLLEAMAQNLYREWFVRGRCPYAEANEALIRLEEIVNTQYGFTASATDENTGVKFLRITDISGNRIDWGNVPFCEVSDEDFSKYELKPGDIVVARIGATAGYGKRIHKRHPKSVFASYLVRMQVKNLLHDYFVGMSVESQDFKDFINQTVGGAAQPQANAPLLTSYEVRLPSDDALRKFNVSIEPLFDLIENLQLQISQLRQMRDKLLPRLMSGQLVMEAGA